MVLFGGFFGFTGFGHCREKGNKKWCSFAFGEDGGFYY